MGAVKNLVLNYFETHNDAELEGLTMGDLIAEIEGEQ